MKKLKISTFTFSLLTLAVSVFSVQFFFSQTTSAAYEAGRIVDDAVLLDARSMNIGQIQNFLNARGGQIASKSFVLDCDAAGQQAKQIYLSLGASCGHTASSASIIYYAAQVYGINPKVIIATMQKEQSLITATNPTARQYAQAMGYACPTSGNCDDSSNFFWQVDNGTWVLRFHFERARGNMNWWYTSSTWTCGTEKNLYKPNLYPGQNVRFYDTNGTLYATIYIQNAATSSFYCYTPHAYNNPQGLYDRAPYGTTGLYYSGSYNFVTAFEQWFGSTQVSWLPLVSPRILVTNKATTKVNPFTDEQVQALPAGQAIRFRTKLGDCLRTEHDTNYSTNACVKINDLNELTSIIEDVNTDSSTSKRVSLQWTCKIDYTTLKVTNQCFNASTTISFQKIITLFGNDYIITKHDADRGITTGFRADRFSPWLPLASPRILVTNKATTKVNPSTGEEMQALSTGQAIRFRTKQGDCLRTEVDTNNNVNACVKISNLDELSSIAKNINDDGSMSKKSSLQWTCKIDYTTLKVTNQCFNASTTISFQKIITLFGNNYIITKHDADRGITTGFRADRFSP